MELQKIALWCAAVTVVLFLIATGGSFIGRIVLIPTVGAGWFVFKPVPEDKRIAVVTIAIVGALIAGYIAPLGIEELGRYLELRDQLVIGLIVLALTVSLGTSLEAIRRITSVE
ncbi:hypothetical protein [Halorubrum amylolyticum]|uniref:hypothetical protein n=1 Tax=Halorubrum TaxID=56688 RepID=UPI001008A780|nr:hypothetical protein [Halorubrum amylolyticum]